MATISSVFKIEDQASRTFEKVSDSISQTLDLADKISSNRLQFVDPVQNSSLASAIDNYDKLSNKAEELGAKLDELTAKKEALTRELNAANVIGDTKGVDEISNKINSINTQLETTNNTWENINNKVTTQAGKVVSLYEKQEQMNKQLTASEKVQQRIVELVDSWQAKLLITKAVIRAIGDIMKTIADGTQVIDSINLAEVKLNMINDGLQTTADLQNKIYLAANRSRVSYEGMLGTITKMGLMARGQFSSNDEMISFTETMQKMFRITGASNVEIETAVRGITRALSIGKIQGYQFRQLMQSSPMIIQAIAKYLDLPINKVQELAKDGQLTADVLKNAIFSAAGEINEQFNQMPMTFEQAGQRIANAWYKYMTPLAHYLSKVLNDEKFQKGIDNILGIIAMGAMALTMAVSGISNVIFLLLSNWDLVTSAAVAFISVLVVNLIPAIWEAVTALGAKALAWMVANAEMLVAFGTIFLVVYALQTMNPLLLILSSIVLALVAAYAIWNVYQWAVNGAMLACPILWIVVGILAIIMAIFMLITWIVKVTGATNTALGYITGALFSAVAFIYNLFLGLVDGVLSIINALVNAFGTLGNFIANVFVDPVASAIHLFEGMASAILDVIKGIARAMDAIFGSNLSGAVQGWQNGLHNYANNLAKKYGNGKYEEVFKAIDLNAKSNLGLQRWSYSDAFNSGLAVGDNISNAISNFNPFDWAKNQMGEVNPQDYSQLDPNAFLDPDGNVPAAIKKDKSGKKEVKISDEDLKFLRDVANHEYMIKYKHITPQVHIEFGDVKETADVHKIKKELDRMMNEELSELYLVEEG